MSNDEDPILFEHFVKLLDSISRIHPTWSNALKSQSNSPRSLMLVNQWFTRLREYYQVIPPETGKIFFRLFFPEEDSRRRYNLQETTLARHLAKDVYGLPTDIHGGGRALMEWSDYPDSPEKAKLGCLGYEIEKALKNRHSVRHGTSPSFQSVDMLLDELASLSGYSNLGVSLSRARRSRVAILRDLYLNLDPVEAKFMTQIILRDLRPVLYPLRETHTTRALLHYKSNTMHILTKWEVMRLWHPNLPRIYRARATLDDAIKTVENLQSGYCDGDPFAPGLGIPVEIPKSQKGNKLSHALNFFKEEREIYAETKYDGERMQIHVDLSKEPNQQITIFSKSKRDSTQDRTGTHAIIRAALGLRSCTGEQQRQDLFECTNSSKCMVTRSVILDAEMVAYSETKGAVDEFWRIRGLVDSSAEGIRHTRYLKTRSALRRNESQVSDTQDTASDIVTQTTNESLHSNCSDNSNLHLMLVFFDILFLDGCSMLNQIYDERRKLLEQVINIIPGFVSLSRRQYISFSLGYGNALYQLARVFSDHIVEHKEGLVLKGSSSTYNNPSKPWVKLKRDYIPGYGDSIDLPILGVGWNKERARGLRVAPETFTTFFIGACHKHVSSSESVSMPHFQILFVVEYGLSREQLEDLNLYVKTWDLVQFQEKGLNVPYKFDLPRPLPRPAFMITQPLLGELFGAGFTKDSGMKHYCLRFPRLTKVWRRTERSWSDGCSLNEFQAIARQSIGCESSDEWANRTVETIWANKAVSKEDIHMDQVSREWLQKLLELEPLSSKKSCLYSAAFPAFSLKTGISNTLTSTSVEGTFLTPLTERKLPARTLGSMTNILKPPTPGSCRDEAGIGSVEVNSERQRSSKKRKRTSARENMQTMIPMSPHQTKIGSASDPNNVNIISLMYLLNQSKASTIPDGNTHSGPAAALTNEWTSLSYQGEDSRLVSVPEDWPQEFIDTPLVQFILDAYVWIHKEENNRRPKDRPPASHIVPQHRRLGTIYFLLMVCGCRVEVNGETYIADLSEFAHIKKCVIFVKVSEDLESKEALTWLIGALESWRSELTRDNVKELFVLDSDILTHISLTTFRGNIESVALWRSRRKQHLEV